MENETENLKKLSKVPIPWYEKLLLKLSPRWFMLHYMKKQNLDQGMLDAAYKLFDNKQIHIEPLTGNNRGFIITINNGFSLWFYQDGKHFKFDGHEIGPYDDGDVTVLDKLK
jgi:hypothetical protein